MENSMENEKERFEKINKVGIQQVSYLKVKQ